MATKSTTKNTARKKSAAAPSATDISIAIEPPKPISVDLGGTVYTVRPVKGSLGIALGANLKGLEGDGEKLLNAMNHIINIIFGKKDAQAVLERVNDPEDALDFTHIMELMNALVERSTGNPTT